MPLHTSGLYHQQLRKRAGFLKKLFSPDDAFKKRLDKLAIVIGVLTPIMTAPQALSIWTARDASGLSGVTWGFFLLVAIFWSIYGIAHREIPIVIMYLSQTIIMSFIVWGIMLYQ